MTQKELMILVYVYLVEHPVKLVPGFNNTVAIVAVHNKDKSLRVLEVVPPQWTDLDEQERNH